jgi:D-glycero-D-manno-heptose 1,7-bisphosphate phosphatase
MTIVVTNQPDVARNAQSVEAVEALHSYMQALLPIDDFRVCYHDDDANCACRKPKPGMLKAAAEQFTLELPRSYMIGDRWRDIEAGLNAGCITIFIDYQYAETNSSQPHVTVNSLDEAVNWIINREKQNENPPGLKDQTVR